MKILYYCPEYFASHGGRTHAREFFRSLEQDERVTVARVFGVSDAQYDTDTKGQAAHQSKLKFLPVSLRWQRILRYWRPKIALTNRVISEAQKMRADILIARTGVRQLLLGRIRRAMPHLSLCLEINSAYFDEGYSDFWLRSFFQRLEVNSFRQAHCVSVVSSYLRDYLTARGFPTEKIIVNHNGVNIHTFSDPTRNPNANTVLATIPSNAYVLGYIGGMESFRRLPLLIRHVANLRRAGVSDLFLLIVGDGKDRPAVQAEILLHASSGQNFTHCTGWLPHEVIPALLHRVDLAVFPYTNPYCSPLKLFEYLGAGIPCIGPDTPAVKEVFTDRQHLLLAAQDGSNFESLVMEVYKSTDRGRAMAQCGQALVRESYTWEQNVSRLLTHIKRHTPPVTSTLVGCKE